LVSSALFSEGCTKKTTAEPAPVQEVNLAIWANYLSPEMQEQFQKETGIKLNVSNYSSNEELLAKLESGSSGIDVAVPSDYMVEILIKMNKLEALDTQQIPNRLQIEPIVLKKEFDPENRYSLPFAWSTTGIAINRDLFKGSISGWKDLLTNKELAGKISLLDDVREVTGAALKTLGYSVNTTNPAELAKAKAVLTEARSRVKMFRSDTIDVLVNREVVAAQSYSPDALLAISRSKDKIEYIFPKEGGTWAIDNMVVLKGSTHAAQAYKLINFLLSPQVNVAFVKKNLGGPVLKITRAQLPPELRNNVALFPPASLLNKLERVHDLGESTRLYDRLWTEFKAE
jgi:spermidine/putrescine transport system substrate-binding protein